MDLFDGRTLLLIAHIAAVVLFVGPFTVAASAFPSEAARAHRDPAAAGAVALLHRITRTYGTSSLAVPAFGVALAAQGGWWSAAWLHVAIALTAAGAVVLAAFILPLQRRAVALLGAGSDVPAEVIGRLHAVTGLYSLTWVAVLVLMVAKPW